MPPCVSQCRHACPNAAMRAPMPPCVPQCRHACPNAAMRAPVPPCVPQCCHASPNATLPAPRVCWQEGQGAEAGQEVLAEQAGRQAGLAGQVAAEAVRSNEGYVALAWARRTEARGGWWDGRHMTQLVAAAGWDGRTGRPAQGTCSGEDALGAGEAEGKDAARGKVAGGKASGISMLPPVTALPRYTAWRVASHNGVRVDMYEQVKPGEDEGTDTRATATTTHGGASCAPEELPF
ncbi:unnamed protein product, partial [Closterium sp. Naga37s-1]